MVTSYLIWWFLTQIKTDKPSFSLSLSQAEFNKVYLKINYDQTSSLNVHIVLIWQEEQLEFGLQLNLKVDFTTRNVRKSFTSWTITKKLPHTHDEGQSTETLSSLNLTASAANSVREFFDESCQLDLHRTILQTSKITNAKYSNNEKGEIFYLIYFLFLILSALCLLLRNVSILYTVMELLNIFLQAHRRTWQNNK